jgi:hypothetical protein
MRMSVPQAEPPGPQSWVRGPTSRRSGAATAVTAAPAAPAATVAGVAKSPPPEPVRTPPAARTRARVRPLSGEGVCWVAAHGGAGTSTLATVLGGTDVGCRWPDGERGEPARIMLVARTHAEGMRSASRALDAIREGRHPAGMELTGLVLVADAPGRLPFALARRVRVLKAVAPVHRVPWIPAWRLGETDGRLPRELSRLASRAGLTAGRGGER